MGDKLLTKEELIEKGFDYEDLEMEPPSDQLFVRTGEEGDDLVPVNGLVYELSEQDGSVLNYGEYADGLPHGISVDFHPNGQVKQIHTHFHGPIHGEQHQWDKEGRLVFWGEYEYGHELKYKRWDESGELFEEKTEPDDSQLAMILQSRRLYKKHYGAE
ncbi:toxin-antitoxin system YwqK family antitoxin [Bhargavaea ginsengi]|uniref:toxin-antitoxin system YwqK family antitoxin n=1 Tax=Bhargavaea ginsengi TaxID=426757 RepID=UPI003C775782